MVVALSALENNTIKGFQSLTISITGAAINPNKGDCGVGHHPLSFYVILLNFALVKILNFFDFS